MGKRVIYTCDHCKEEVEGRDRKSVLDEPVNPLEVLFLEIHNEEFPSVELCPKCTELAIEELNLYLKDSKFFSGTVEEGQC